MDRAARPLRRRRRLAPEVDAPGRRRLPVLLRRAWYGLNQVFRRRVAALGVTPDQCTILRWLHEAPPEGMTQRQLGLLMSSDPNTIASLLNRMRQLGLIERQRHSRDARCNLVRVTPKGRLLFRKTRPIAANWQREALAVIPPGRRESFLRDLEAVGDITQMELARSRGAGLTRDDDGPQARA